MKKIGTVNKTREILEKNGFMMKKKFGQNFLIDQNILSSIVSKAEINKGVNVIEIGPGIGSLTEHLLENANKVISYEIDNTLIPILTEEFKEYDNFTLLNQDILKANIKEDINKVNIRLAEIEDEIKEADRVKGLLEEEIRKYKDGKALQDKRDKLTCELKQVSDRE